MRGRRLARGARSARARETCRGRTEPRRCPPAQRERVCERCPLIFSPALCFQTSQRKQNTKVTVTGVACSRRTRAPRLLAAHSRPPRDAPAWPRALDAAAPSSRSAPPSGGEQALPAREWDVRAEGSCPGRELSALACLAGRHAAAWSADGSGLEHRLLWHQATERRQQSPEAADPEGRAAHGWADRDHGEARWRQERRSFRCRRRGEQIRQRHWRGLTCAEATPSREPQ